MRRYTAVPVALVLLMAGAWSVPANGSVVVNGTRVIYPGQAREKTVRLTNQDHFSNVVQAWVDIDDPVSTPETADAPFLVNPAVSRLASGSGQTLRIIYTGEGLPQDRESLFHLNILQIPPRNTAHADRDQVLLMLRNRLKVFYRPEGVAGNAGQLPEKLQFSLAQVGSGWHVEVHNPTGFYASFGSATLQVGNHHLALQPAMVEPFGKAEWALPDPGRLPDGVVQLRAQLINDYGAQVGILHELSR
ncbi:fimbrial chaperone protein [Pseudomonas cremoricolorata]|uniref:Fimbrial chaperone protein n=2 Tax=Pseudomonas cremoricolorata TaxID=157783 RepID=A0A089WYH2_9PSED|nr:fimbrial chaperone protein [Pseudomonas cremoricolorata]